MKVKALADVFFKYSGEIRTISYFQIGLCDTKYLIGTSKFGYKIGNRLSRRANLS